MAFLGSPRGINPLKENEKKYNHISRLGRQAKIKKMNYSIGILKQASYNISMKTHHNISTAFKESLLPTIIKTGIFIILFLPLFVEKHFLFPFVFPKTIAFRILVEILLVCSLYFGLYEKKYQLKFTKTHILIMLFVGIMCLSSILGSNPYRSFWSSIERSEGILTWIHLVLFFFIIAFFFRTKKEWNELLNTALFAGALQSLYALGQYFNASFALKTSGERIGGSIGNPSFLAAYLLFIIFIAAFLYFEKSTRKYKFFYIALIVTDIFLLWQTQTRGAIIGLMAGTLIVLLVYARSSRSKISKIIFIGTICFFIATSIFIFVNKNAQWMKNYSTLNRLASISKSDVSARNRLIVWKVGVNAFFERPMLGWGYENFYIAFNKHFDPSLTEDIGSHPWYDRAHNVVVEILVTIGLFGFIVFMLIFFWMIKIFWQSQKEGIVSQASAGALIAVIVAYGIQNLFVFDTLSSYIMLFVLLGLCAHLEISSTIKKVPILSISLYPTLVALSIPVVAVSLWYFNVRPILKSYYTVMAATKYKTDISKMIESFKQSFAFSPSNDQELRFVLVQYARDQAMLRGITPETAPLITFAIEEMERSIQADRYAAQNYIILSELYLATYTLNPKHINRAQELALLAQKEAPKRYQIFTLLGRIKMSRSQFAEGIYYFNKAIELNDQFAESYWNLAIAYILSGKPAQSEEYLLLANKLGFDIYKKENVQKLISAYEDAGDKKGAIEYLKKISTLFPENIDYKNLLIEFNR